MKNLSDRELSELMAADPEKGLRAVIGQYTPYVMKIIRIRTGGACTPEDMEETAADVFMDFYRASLKGEPGSVRALLAVIARRRCADMLGKAGRRRDEVPLDESLTTQEPDAADRLALSQAIHSLGPPDEEIFLRRYFLGQTSAQIGKDLGMRENTVDKRISRGLRRLREILKEGMT